MLKTIDTSDCRCARVKIINIETVIPRHKALSILKKLPLFHGIDDAELDYVLEYCVIDKFQSGQTIFTQGNSAQSLFIVLNGAVEIFTPEKGVINIMHQGEVFGELGVITSMPRLASALTLLDNTLLLEIKKSDLDFLVGKQPHLSYAMMKNLASALAERYVQVNKENFSTRTQYSPLAKNISLANAEMSGPIVIGHDQEKMGQVTQYYISSVSHGQLFAADGECILEAGSFISLDVAQQGLRFQLNQGSRKGWFDVHLSTQEHQFMRESDKSRVYIFGYAPNQAS